MWGNLRVGARWGCNTRAHTHTRTGSDMHSNTRSLTADNLTPVAPLQNANHQQLKSDSALLATFFFRFRKKKKKKAYIGFTWRLRHSPFERGPRPSPSPSGPPELHRQPLANAAVTPSPCAHWRLPVMCSDGASLAKLSAPLNPHTLPLTYSHGNAPLLSFQLAV